MNFIEFVIEEFYRENPKIKREVNINNNDEIAWLAGHEFGHYFVQQLSTLLEKELFPETFATKDWENRNFASTDKNDEAVVVSFMATLLRNESVLDYYLRENNEEKLYNNSAVIIKSASKALKEFNQTITIKNADLELVIACAMVFDKKWREKFGEYYYQTPYSVFKALTKEDVDTVIQETSKNISIPIGTLTKSSKDKTQTLV
ncbi:MAG: hypothetical protein ACK5BE_05000 [Alphaproteobacteria bacterium]|jgi:hypothetical protein